MLYGRNCYKRKSSNINESKRQTSVIVKQVVAIGMCESGFLAPLHPTHIPTSTLSISCHHTSIKGLDCFLSHGRVVQVLSLIKSLKQANSRGSWGGVD